MNMFAAGDNLARVLYDASRFFSFLLFAMLGVMLLCYIITATLAQVSKQRDEVEQLALKFSHKK
jgi:hypothetical protein